MKERIARAIMLARYRMEPPASLQDRYSEGGILLPISIQQENYEECLRDASAAIAEYHKIEEEEAFSRLGPQWREKIAVLR